MFFHLKYKIGVPPTLFPEQVYARNLVQRHLGNWYLGKKKTEFRILVKDSSKHCRKLLKLVGRLQHK